MLSGFLDKMIPDPSRHDQWTYQNENEHLQLHKETPWENSQESYAKFVQRLSEVGLGGVVRCPRALPALTAVIHYNAPLACPTRSQCHLAAV